MNDQTDQQLLRAYTEHKSEAAFAAIVHRYVDLVYSAALRLIWDAHSARDVTQSVFVALAQNAQQLTARPALAGWLHGTTRNLAVKAIRSDVRRRSREQEAAVMNELLSAHPDASWEHIAPHLDEALGELSEPDRDAVLLRYFKNHDLRTVGATLGISDDAAQKRVSRAVERLREFFAKRGVTVGASGLVVVISTNAVQAAPVGLALTISTAAALTGTTLATTATVTATKAIAMTALQKTIVTATIAVLAGGGIYEARHASQLRDLVQTFQQERAPLAHQVQQLRRERDDATNRLTLLAEESERLKRNTNELLKLRNEVTALRQTARERAITKTTTENWEARITLLKQRFDQMPDRRIPEMEFLTDKDWAAATRNADMDTDDGMRQAMSNLRSAAKDIFLDAMCNAIRKYAAAVNGASIPEGSAQFAQAVNANSGLLPTDFSQLKPYFDVAVDDTTLQRYQLLHPMKLHNSLSDILVKEIAPAVDTEYDTRHEKGLNSGGVRMVNLIADTVAAAIESYAQANNGKKPDEPAQIAPYLTQPLDAALVQKYLGKLATNTAH